MNFFNNILENQPNFIVKQYNFDSHGRKTRTRESSRHQSAPASRLHQRNTFSRRCIGPATVELRCCISAPPPAAAINSHAAPVLLHIPLPIRTSLAASAACALAACAPAAFPHTVTHEAPIKWRKKRTVQPALHCSPFTASLIVISSPDRRLRCHQPET